MFLHDHFPDSDFCGRLGFLRSAILPFYRANSAPDIRLFQINLSLEKHSGDLLEVCCKI
jgi:hypothetical protein